MQEPNYLSCRSDSTGKLEYNGQYNMGSGFSLKSEGFFPNEDLNNAHMGVELMKEFDDCHFAYKTGDGAHHFSMMQTVSENLTGGFEAMYVPHTRDVIFNYAGKFQKDIHTLVAQYVPVAKKETLSLGYVAKPSKKLTLCSELKTSPEGFSDTTMGFRLRFTQGMISGTISTSYKAQSVLQHQLDQFIQMSFHLMFGFRNETKAPFITGQSCGCANRE